MFTAFANKQINEHHDDPEMAAWLEDKSAMDLLDCIKEISLDAYDSVEEVIRQKMSQGEDRDAYGGDIGVEDELGAQADAIDDVATSGFGDQF